MAPEINTKLFEDKMSWPDFFVTTSLDIYFFSKGVFKKIPTTKHRSLKDNQPNFYGFTWDKNSFYVNTDSQLLKLDKYLEHDVELYKDGGGIHQCCFYDGSVFLMNTSHNTVEEINVVTGKVKTRSWRKEKEDVEHINSIFKYDDHFFVCHHNHSNGSFITKFNKNFMPVGRFDGAGVFSHNVYIEDGFIYTLSSGDDRVVRVSLVNKDVRAKDLDVFDIGMKKKKFLRGLARTDENYLIGVTVNGVTRKDRDANPSWVIMTDNKFNVIDFVELPNEGQIRDIRVASKTDYAHNGLRCPFYDEQ